MRENVMNDLQKYFENNQGNMIDKWMHYFDVYDKYFAQYRGKEIVFVEIGIFQGGSLQMWKNYFGEKAKIYGIDINPECKKFEDEQITILIGDQEDKNFLAEIKRQIPQIDILLDDGGHTMKQQINTFEVLFDHIKDGGVFLCEDLHTSYWWQYGGGLRKHGTFIEYAKRLIDDMHAWYSRTSNLQVNQYTKSIKALHFYDSIVVVEKDKVEEPVRKQTGQKMLPDFYPETSWFFKLAALKQKLFNK